MAGFLAPVVAFIPTAWSANDCPSNLTASTHRALDQFFAQGNFFGRWSANNMLAFVLAGLAGILIIGVVAFIKGRQSPLEGWLQLLLPAAGAALVALGELLWHDLSPANFNTHAHSFSAIAMFLCLAVVAFLTGLRDEGVGYRLLYFGCVGLMVVGGIVCVIVVDLTVWTHEVLILELIEIVGVSVFWFFQTIQLWDSGPAQRSTYRWTVRSD
jgi:hypothetical protein